MTTLKKENFTQRNTMVAHLATNILCIVKSTIPIFTFTLAAVLLLSVSNSLFAQNWYQQGQSMEGGASYDVFGISVSISADGSRVAIGGEGNNGVKVGHVRVYDWNGSAWVQAGIDINGEVANGGGFAIAVDLSDDGNRLAIGTRNTGYVRIYNWNGSAWVQMGADIDGEVSGDKSGASVSLSGNGNRVAIGAPQNNGNGHQAGHVRVYDWNGSAWVQAGADIDGEAVGDEFGISVSLSSNGNRLAAGAYKNSGNGSVAGHVRVYNWNGSSWVQSGTDIDGKGGYESFGVSVSLSSDGNRFASGANSPLLGLNQIRVYDWNGSDWVQTGTDIDGDGGSFGSLISLSGDGSRVASGSWQGYMKVYEWNGIAWGQVGPTLNAQTTNGEIGDRVALNSDGSRVIVGVTEYDNARGQARVFGPEASCAPSISCKSLSDIDLEGCASDVPAALTNPEDVFEIEACGATVTMTSSESGDTDFYGDGDGIDFIRTYTLYLDGTAQTPTCTQSIRIDDTTPPTVSCPADVTVDHDENTSPANTGQATAADNCGTATVSFTDNTISGSCPVQTIILRSWTAEDEAGNESSLCEQTITVLDADSDGDGTVDCSDECPNDPDKTDPGVCGCGVSDADNDADNSPDCVDPDDDNDGQSDEDEIVCGSDPLDASSTSADNDADGIPDCLDDDDDNDGCPDTEDAQPLVDAAPVITKIKINKKNKIRFSAEDDCEVVSLTAVIVTECEEIPVTNGLKLDLECDDDDCESEFDDGELEIEASSATLIVTATDNSGNTSVSELVLCDGEGDDDDDDDDDEDDDRLGRELGQVDMHVYPNPSANEMRFGFFLPEAGEVRIDIFNLQGQRVKSFAGNYQPGEHEIYWNGLTGTGMKVAKGMYFARLNTAQGTVNVSLVRK